MVKEHCHTAQFQHHAVEVLHYHVQVKSHVKQVVAVGVDLATGWNVMGRNILTVNKNVKNNKVKAFILTIIIFATGCVSVDNNIPEKKLLSDIQIEMYSDSSFFSDIRCMQFANDKVFVLDVKRKDIAVLDTSMNIKNYVGRAGQGPEELASPLSFYVNFDTVNVLDAGFGIKKFVDNRFNASLKLHSALDKRFVVNDVGHCFIPDISELGVFYKIDESSKSVIYSGKTNGTDNSFLPQKTINANTILYDKKNLFCVPEAIPIIEKFNALTMKHESTINISSIPFIDNNLKYIKSQANDGGYYVLFVDAYLHNNMIYILCNTLDENFRTNTIVCVDISEMKVTHIYKLPGKIYYSFCVSDEYIFAFEKQINTIQRFRY